MKIETASGERPIPPAGKAAHDRWIVPGICLLLAAAVWLVFGQTMRFGFINFDDDVYVLNNPHVTSGLHWKDILWAFTHAYASNWHPATWISHMLDCQWYGLHAGGHHLTNLLLHLANAILLFLVLRQLTGFLWRSAFVAAVFALHPLRVESVAWIAERKDVLCGLFFWLTLSAYIYYARRPWSLTRYLIVMLMFALALMSKPMVVTLPLVLLLLDYWPWERFTLAARPKIQRRVILEKIPLLLLSALVCAITIRAQSDATSPQPLSLRLGNALVSGAIYLEQMVWPSGLAVFYPYPETGLAFWKVALSAAVLLAISAVALVRRKQQPWLIFGWLWYWGMLLPVIGILQAGSQAHADRYTYLPQIGLYVMLTWTVTELCSRWRHHQVLLSGLAALVLAACIVCARTQTARWKNSETLWAHTYACTGNSLTTDINYGNALLASGQSTEALALYQNALKISPGNPDANVSLGYLLVQQGKADAAMTCFQQALASRPDDAEAHNDLGIVLAEQGKDDAAMVHFQKAIQVKPNYAEACYNLGNALFRKGAMDEAEGYYRQALKLNPDYPEASYNLGNTLFQNGKVDDAIRCYRKTLQIKPDDANAGYNLALALVQQGRLEEAINCFQKVLALKPDSAEADYNLGNAYLQKGDTPKALHCFEQAIAAKPDYSTALNDLAWILATAPQTSVRNGAKAVQLAERANRLAEGKDLDILDTLAAAYAEAGSFGDAIRTAQRAIELARSMGENGRAGQFNQELALYEKNVPFHLASPQ